MSYLNEVDWGDEAGTVAVECDACGDHLADLELDQYGEGVDLNGHAPGLNVTFAGPDGEESPTGIWCDRCYAAYAAGVS